MTIDKVDGEDIFFLEIREKNFLFNHVLLPLKKHNWHKGYPFLYSILYSFDL